MNRKFLLILSLLAIAAGAKPQSSPIGGGGSNDPDGRWSDVDNRDTEWATDYATASSFTITTPQQLAQFAYLVNNGSDFSGKTVTLNQREERETAPYGQQAWTYDDYEMNAHYWTPIGTAEHPFCGTFDGNGMEVNYMTIDATNATHQGFFGYIGQGGSVVNTTVRMSTMAASSHVGAIAGYNLGTISNCVVTDVTITATGYAGAIVGRNAGTLSNCYAIKANIPAVGDATSGYDITGQAERLFTVTGEHIQASIGTPTGTTLGTAVFYDDGIQFNYYHYYKTGATATLTYTRQGYDATFTITSGAGATISQNVLTVGCSNVEVAAATTVAEWSGTGASADDPYSIFTREQLEMLATRVNSGTSIYEGKFFRLENDISYSDDSDAESTPIGTLGHPFCGNFDGNGNQIQYAGSNGGQSSYQGIFGYIGTQGTVKNLQAASCAFQGYEYIGVIAGYNAGTIENCRVKYESNYGGNVTFTFTDDDPHSCYGTIAGYNSGTVSECVSYGVVAPGNSVDSYTNVTKCGGIVGHNRGVVKNCLFLGSSVIGTAYVGAIVGHNDEGATLTNNYYHDNGRIDDGNVAKGTVKGVGASAAVTGSDDADAAMAKVVRLPVGDTLDSPYSAELVATPSMVTTNSPNERNLTVYDDGILFNDDYMEDIYGHAFYTSATTITLDATNVPAGFVASLSTTSDGASFNGNTLTIGTEADVIEVTVSARRVPNADSWLADGIRANSFSTMGDYSITIKSAAELGLLAYKVNFDNETYQGYTIALGTGIDLEGHAWEPIGYGLEADMGGGSIGIGGDGASSYGFLGTFDGASNGTVYPILNMNVTGSSSVGLFSNVQSGVTVRNVILQSPLVQGEQYVGAIAGMCSGTIENCHVSNGSVEFLSTSSETNAIGGIAGLSQGGSIKGCTVIGTNIYPVVASAQGIGGIVGGVSPKLDYDTYSLIATNLRDCLFAGNIFKISGNNYVGAIAGLSQQENIIANNYYVDGGSPVGSVTPNTDLKAINGDDNDGAGMAYIYNSKPDGFGDAVTDYGYGMEAYSTGLHYNTMWYSPNAPTTMDITLSDMGDNSTLLTAYKGNTGKVTLDRTFYKDGDWNTICLPFDIADVNNSPLCDDGETVELYQLVGTTKSGETGFDEDSGTLTLSFESCYDDDSNETALIAGHPYLIRWKDATGTLKKPVFENVTITETAPKEEGNTFGINDVITFIGTFNSMSFSSENRSILFLGASNKLYFPQPIGEPIPTIGVCRAYFQLNGITAGDLSGSGAVRAFVLRFVEDPSTQGDNFGEEDSTQGVTTPLSTGRGAGGEASWHTLDGRRLNGKPDKSGIYISGGQKLYVK